MSITFCIAWPSPRPGSIVLNRYATILIYSRSVLKGPYIFHWLERTSIILKLDLYTFYKDNSASLGVLYSIRTFTECYEPPAILVSCHYGSSPAFYISCKQPTSRHAHISLPYCSRSERPPGLPTGGQYLVLSGTWKAIDRAVRSSTVSRHSRHSRRGGYYHHRAQRIVVRPRLVCYR